MKNWESVLLSPTATLREAMAALGRGGFQITVIVDEERRVLGTLTDGDIRRALLRQLPMDSPCGDIMCRTPETASNIASKEELLARMERRRLLQIPLVDAHDRIVGIQTLHNLLHTRRKDNAVFLMAGGFGKRLQPLTDHCPKPLLKVGEKTILEIIIENFVSAGFHRFFISTHYRPEMIRQRIGDGRRWNIDIEYVHEDDPLGTGGALGLLPKERIQEPMFMMNGDLLTNLDFNKLLDFHESHDDVATMCVREYEHRVPYGVIQSDGLRVTSMVEKPAYRYFINAGIYVLSPQILNAVRPGQRIDMPTLLEEQMAKEKQVNMFPVHEYWLDVGRMEDFQRAQDEVGGILSG
ncbi:MAG: nucleotidyltransferase family protein [Steroidobacteraceae bacterium]